MKKLFLPVLLSLGLMACGKSENSNPTPATGGVSTTGVANQIVSACGTNDLMQTGRVYDDSNGSVNPNFNDQLKNFISGFVDPTTIDYVSGRYDTMDRVEITGKLKFDAQGALIPSLSSIVLKIYDQNYSDYTVNFIGSTYQQAGKSLTGKYNYSTRDIDVVFSDPVGSFTIAARYDTPYVSGSIHFNNLKNVVSGQPPKSGRLGAFYISACALL